MPEYNCIRMDRSKNVRKLNLFKKIFVKNLQNGTPPTILADDVGPLKGIFSFRGFNIHTGKLVSKGEFHNMIVNQSKSSIIRLLAQGQSIYKGVIDPTQYRISKMRFSNDMGTGLRGIAQPHRLEYYALSEASNRISYASNNIFGGGVKTQATCEPPLNPSEIEYKHIFENDFNNEPGVTGYQAAPGGKIFDLKSGARPVSHGSVNVKFYKNFGSGEQLIEEHDYSLKIGGNLEATYTRDAFKNHPYRITNYKVAGFYYHVSTPMDASTIFTNESGDTIRHTVISETGGNTTGTRIFYDYTSGQQGWKIYIQEITLDLTQIPANYTNTRIASGNNPQTTNYVWDKIVISFTLGKHNIINLIIPKYGTNNGFGTSQLIRYGNQNGDAYDVVAPVYQDSGDDFIDDYAVTFTTSMNADQGNGVGAVGADVLRYTKAYLFSQNDEMFSSILFPTSDFEKNASNSYQISWKILAPVE